VGSAEPVEVELLKHLVSRHIFFYKEVNFLFKAPKKYKLMRQTHFFHNSLYDLDFSTLHSDHFVNTTQEVLMS